MQLSTLVDPADTDLDGGSRYSIYLCHCLYLGTVMLFHRRIVLALGRLDPDEMPGIERMLRIEGLTHDSVAAAHQTASILGLLRDEGAVFERCWIILSVSYSYFVRSALMMFLSFQAHASATTLMYDLARRKADGAHFPSAHEETLGRIRICMQLVMFCAAVDPVARVFQRTLQPYFAKFSASNGDLTGELDVDWKYMKDQLYYQMLMPYEKVTDRATIGNLTHDCESYLPIQSSPSATRTWTSNLPIQAARRSGVSHCDLE